MAEKPLQQQQQRKKTIALKLCRFLSINVYIYCAHNFLVHIYYVTVKWKMIMAIVDQYKYFSMMVMVIVAARIDIHTHTHWLPVIIYLLLIFLVPALNARICCNECTAEWQMRCFRRLVMSASGQFCIAIAHAGVHCTAIATFFLFKTILHTIDFLHSK